MKLKGNNSPAAVNRKSNGLPKKPIEPAARYGGVYSGDGSCTHIYRGMNPASCSLSTPHAIG